MFPSKLMFKASTFGKYSHFNQYTRLLPTITSFFSPLRGLKSENVIELPDKPKRPSTPFIKFVKENRPILLKEHPQWKITEVVKKCAENWKEVHSTVKQRYEDEYKAEYAAYAEKYLKYAANLTEEQKAYIKEVNHERKESLEKKRVKKKLRELNKPKKPLTPYVLYLMHLAKSQGKKFNEVVKETKGQWENLDKSVKSSYIEESERAHKVYQEEIYKWEMRMLQQGHEDFIRTKTLKEEQRKIKEADSKGLKSNTGTFKRSVKGSEQKESSDDLAEKSSKK